MLTMRDEQLAAMARGAVREFEDGMVAHLQECFREEYTVLGEEGARALIRHGIERAETYGLLTEYEVCLYIDLVVLFDRDFDTNPTLPWAAEYLNSPSLRPRERIELVYEAALEDLDRKAGIGGPVPADEPAGEE
jgi:hypothetical protein